MDYDADGRTDIVTGSYTGQFYLFRRQADGAFAQRELLVDETGATLMMPFEKIYSVTAELVDMDADGDLDLVVGTRSAAVQIVTNLGTRQQPVWSKARQELKTTGGARIQGSNAHHADWDGDGVRDLIVGSEWGEVRWYRNVGANDAPKYEAGEVLVAKSDSRQDPEGATPKRPGMRVKVHVNDWDEDGRADLLVGDVTWQESTPKPLTADEEKAKAALEEELARMERKLEDPDDRKQAEELKAAIADARKTLRGYDRTKLHTHGWVWLYRRAGRAAK